MKDNEVKLKFKWCKDELPDIFFGKYICYVCVHLPHDIEYFIKSLYWIKDVGWTESLDISSENYGIADIMDVLGWTEFASNYGGELSHMPKFDELKWNDMRRIKFGPRPNEIINKNNKTDEQWKMIM